MLATKLGKFPHEILELSCEEMGLLMLCYQQADATSAQMIQRLSNAGSPVFPVVILKG